MFVIFTTLAKCIFNVGLSAGYAGSPRAMMTTTAGAQAVAAAWARALSVGHLSVRQYLVMRGFEIVSLPAE